MDTNFLTTHEIASISNSSKVRIDRLIVNAGIPFNRYHHRVVVKVSDLVVFLARKLSPEELISPTEHTSSRKVTLGVRLTQGRAPP